ncbi:MAG TPA: HAMP domain-containing sensor histidine kinase [Labilithrix sp.]|nr:HAMP domain-containing sensor histidine kinase [Labilithrix sp.]
MDRHSWTVWLPTIFAVVVLSFFGATALGQLQMFAADRPALAIADAAAPSIEQLATARGQIRELQVHMREDLDRLERGQMSEPRAFLDARVVVDRALDRYLVLPVWPEELALWSDVLRSKDALDRAVTVFAAETAAGDVVAANATLMAQFASAANQLSEQILKLIELNAAHAHDLALEIRRLRHRAMYGAFGLDLVAASVAFAGAHVLRRMIRAHAELAEKHRRLEERRAGELEQFSARVAHDILSPLSTVSFAMQLVLSGAEEPERRRRIVERATAAVDRVKRLVDGLLDFARAGAAPAPDVRSDVRATMRDLASELEPMANAAGIVLTVTDDGPCFTKCNAGVLTSLIANPARNAIKYIGHGSERRVEIRSRHDDAVVRVEVEDTGPGFPPELGERAFEPYARGAGEGMPPGIGLGLATMKRLAEAHGGRVGLSSVPGRGCTVWFELPNADRDEVVAAPSPALAAT